MNWLAEQSLQYKIVIQACLVSFFLMSPALFPSRHKIAYYFRNWLPNFSLGLLNTFLFIVFLGDALRGPNSIFFNPHWGLLNILPLTGVSKLILGFLFIDLLIYWWHRLNHEINFFWYFHATHHSDQKMDASTAYRFHFIEVGVSFAVKGASYLLLGISFETVVIYELFYNAFNLFVHSDMKLSTLLEQKLASLFVTPRQHQIHHSKEMKLHNSNYGTIFNFWDRVFNSLSPICRSDNVELGVQHIPPTYNPWHLLALPLTYSQKLKSRVKNSNPQ